MVFVRQWYARKKWKAYRFQLALAEAYFDGYNGLLNAPTGSGKTYAMWIPVLAEQLAARAHADLFQKEQRGLKVLWVTPLRALAKDICAALQDACEIMELSWRVELRTGDVPAAVKSRQKREMPDCLIITPESLHVLLAGKNYSSLFQHLECVVVDEWHELIGSKRGVQVELALSRLRGIAAEQCRSLRTWGISATIGNLVEALEVLTGENTGPEEPGKAPSTIIRSEHFKKIEVHTVLPESIEVLPWAGHIGLKLLPRIVEIIENSGTTLVFTNTRAMAEIWYHQILNYREELAGLMAMHHGSLSAEVRDWVEESLHAGTLKAVICTSSLDLGVDFRPVDTVIQIGSPKGVARFTQRAGRSGHRPGAVSKIHFIPTHALELVEIAAIKEALQTQIVERRDPFVMCFDVLVQYVVTLSCGEGFEAEKIYRELLRTHAYQYLSRDEWESVLRLITSGGDAFSAYDDFSRVGFADGKYRIMNRKAASRHRMQIGTIVSDPVVHIAFLGGGRLGTMEEYFVSQLQPGNIFWFAGQCLEFLMLKEMTAYVRKAKEQKAITASYMGGRMPLSGYMAELMRVQLEEAATHRIQEAEYRLLEPLLSLQKERSMIPTTKQLLIETCESEEGYHLFFYPFEGRVVHEVLSGLAAYRLSRLHPMSISVAMNDYGFELLCNEPVTLDGALVRRLLAPENMEQDLFGSVNALEMARRKFRDIAIISGMLFQGFPGELKRSRHLQSSAQLLFDVLREYDPRHLLLRQAFDEILHAQMEHARLRGTLLRIARAEICIRATEKFSPFAFPIVVDSLRDRLSSEKLSDRIRKMVLAHGE